MSDSPEQDEARAPRRPKKTRTSTAAEIKDGEKRPARRPPSGELEALSKAFDAGDYAFVRREGPRFAKQTDDDGERSAARALLRRIEPDPMAKWFFGGAALLLVFLAGWYWMHPHGGP